MTELQINKTWNDRMTGGVINHFFENMEEKNFVDSYSHRFNRFNADGTITDLESYGKYMDSYHNTGMRWFLASKEALDEVDTLNSILFNKLTDIEIPTDSVYYSAGARYAYALIDGIFETYGASDFGTFINNNITGKENAYWKPINDLNFGHLTVTPNNVTNSINVKYSQPFKFNEHFNQADFLAGGNTDLFLVIPYVRYDGHRSIVVRNPETGFAMHQASYIALKITDMTGDGDIKFDHIDDIDYIDKLEFTLTTPHLI